MLRAKDGRGFIAAIVCVALAGCQQAATLPFPDYSEADQTLATSGPNAFDDYVEAANLAEKEAAKYASRTHLTPGQRGNLIRMIQPALSKVSAAGGRECQFRFEPAKPFEQRPHRTGWRLIGQALTWRIENAVREENYDAAIQDCLVATRFGFDLAGGDCADASLGYAIVDDARRALLKAVANLSAAQMRKLASGLEKGLSRAPKLDEAIENERLNMLAAVDAIQDAYAKSDFKTFRAELRQEIQPAIKYLQALDKNDPERAKYFDSLAKEADALTDDYVERANVNARQRAEIKPPKFSDSRPWRRWSKYFFRGPQAVFAMRDRTYALTRLLALNALIRADSKTSGEPPKTLAKYPTGLTIDPYSGETFVYSATPVSFEIYSVGGDFRDDGGETDESFTTPDLTLESGGF